MEHLLNSLRTIWRDIRRGENLEVYLTVVVSIVVTILAITGRAPPEWIAALTLTVLSLLAISILGSRHRQEELFDKFNQTIDSVFLEEYPPSLKADIEKAKTLLIVGVTLGRTIKTNYTLFERKIRNGDSIMFLLVNPDGSAITMADARAYWSIDIERSRAEIRGTLSDLLHLKEIAPKRVRVHTIDYPLSFGAVLANADTPSGVLYLEHYPFKVERESRPKFVLRPRDGRWYEQYKGEVSKLWEASKEWQS